VAGILTDARPRIVPFVKKFACFNPHASITLKYEAEVGGFEKAFPATESNWKRWLPSDPTSQIEGADINALAEPVTIQGDKREELENSDVTDDEIDFLLGEGEFEDDGPRRIELNALTSRQLVDLIERRLDDNGIKKVVPASDRLADAFRAYTRAPKITEAIEKAIKELPDDAVEVPADLEERVRDYLDEHPECPWEEAVAAIAEEDEDE
jgi:transglutaminase-like putative cysteine protease